MIPERHNALRLESYELHTYSVINEKSMNSIIIKR